jgi:hypothetical protein
MLGEKSLKEEIEALSGEVEQMTPTDSEKALS